jgi:hypothetical protein
VIGVRRIRLCRQRLSLSCFPVSPSPCLVVLFPLVSLSAFPLSAFPLSAFPLSAFPLSAFPLSAFGGVRFCGAGVSPAALQPRRPHHKCAENGHHRAFDSAPGTDMIEPAQLRLDKKGEH